MYMGGITGLAHNTQRAERNDTVPRDPPDHSGRQPPSRGIG